MNQFSDPGKEKAIIGCVIAETFNSLPPKAYIPVEAFDSPEWRLIYQTAISIAQRGQPVCVQSVNDRLKVTGLDAEVQRAIDPTKSVSWECWSQDPDCSIAFSPLGTKYCMDELLRLYHEREANFLSGQHSSGKLDTNTFAAQFEILQKLRHGTNGNGNSRNLLDFLSCPPRVEDTILGNRFLCRGGGMLFIGPSGIGKSSASVQQDILWSMGLPAFGIRPAKALKIVTIQAEDDDGDLYEMVEGVCKFLQISDEQKENFKGNCVYISHKSLTGRDFIEKIVQPALDKHKPDLLRLNPLQAYLGADIKDPKETGEFLRNGLNPLLERYKCAAEIVHHTPKTNFRDTEEWKASDWMYAGAGSADITNWARAILIADPSDEPNIFRWIAAKRGSRIGWVDDDGNPVPERYFSHTGGSIYWDETPIDSIPARKEKKLGGSKAKYSEQDVLENISMTEARKTKVVQTLTMERCGMSSGKFYEFWNPLRESGKLIENKDGWRRII